MKALLFFILICLLGTSCTKDCPPPPQPITKTYRFDDITPRDVNGQLQGAIDPTDWGVGDIWQDWEESLFEEQSPNTCSLDSSFAMLAYPNPATGQFALQLNKPDSARFAFRVVDETLMVWWAEDSLFGDLLQFDASQFGIQDTMRLYYKYFLNGCEFRGHGDIVIQ